MLIRTGLLTGLFSLSAMAVSAQTAPPAKPDIETVCASTVCRSGGLEIVLRLNTDSYTQIPVGKSPYIIEDGAILIYPGETIAIKYEVTDGKPTNPKFFQAYAPDYPMKVVVSEKVVDNADDRGLPPVSRDKEKALLPPNIILLSYGQMDGKPDMMLTIESTLPEIVKFDATMAIVAKGGGYDLRPTSTCPVHGSLYEHWPHPIGPIILENIRFLPANADMTCK